MAQATEDRDAALARCRGLESQVGQQRVWEGDAQERRRELEAMDRALEERRRAADRAEAQVHALRCVACPCCAANVACSLHMYDLGRPLRATS